MTLDIIQVDTKNSLKLENYFIMKIF